MIILTLLITLPIIPVLTQTTDLSSQTWHSCSDAIFCNDQETGRTPHLQEILQRSGIFPDSKTYVDLTLINTKNTTLKNFDQMMAASNKNPTKTDVLRFMEKNLKNIPESDQWTPPDLSNSPPFLDRIIDRNIQHFAKKLTLLWPILGRKAKEHVKKFPDQHSLVWLPNGFIIPGGRFREQVYWDSYWIIKGLLLCGMKETVKGMLSNFVFLIKNNESGCIPTAGRKYFEYRSNPPLFAAMIALYLEQTNDIEWLRNNINTIERHYENFWYIHRTIDITINNKLYTVVRYGSLTNIPRPEHWIADTATCSIYKDDESKRKCYNSLKAASDSGWHYSTRWIYDDEGDTNSSLGTLDLKRTIPVDLNAMICQSAFLLSNFFDKLGNKAAKIKYFNIYKQKLKDMEELFYNQTDGIWYDFDKKNHQHRRRFYASNFAPLWTDCVDSHKKEYYGQRAAEYIYSQGADKYLGGVPTSLDQESDENWDFQNVWPPLQDIVVTGLYNSGNLQAKRLAKKFAHRFIVSSMKGWVSTSGVLYDKYSINEPGMYGKGGDFPVQLGYGWSVGVALSFIERFTCSARVFRAILNPLFYTAIFSFITFLR